MSVEGRVGVLTDVGVRVMSGVSGTGVKVENEARVGGGVRVVQPDNITDNRVKKSLFIEDIVNDT